MPQNGYVFQRVSEIEQLIDYAVQKSNSDSELDAYMASYISVLISGVVADCIEYLVVERAKRTNDPELQEFVRVSMDRDFRNPNSEAIATLLSKFSSECERQYKSTVPLNSREALGSVIRNRLSLAHSGRNQNDFTINDIRQYFEQIVGILEVVEGILLPPPISQPSLVEAVTPC